MSAPPRLSAARASGGATIVRPRITARERSARIIQRRELLSGWSATSSRSSTRTASWGSRGVAAQPAAVPRRVLRRLRPHLEVGRSRRSRSICCRACSYGTCSRQGWRRDRVGRRELRPREEGLVPTRDPSARGRSAACSCTSSCRAVCCSWCSAIVRWQVAWAYIPLPPVRARRAPARDRHARHSALGGQRLPP